MQLIVRAFPVLAGKEQLMRQFAQEVQTTRAAEVTDFYRRMGVGRESWHFQVTPHGSWVIGVTQIPEKPVEHVGREYSASQHPFDRWFKDQVIAITGLDPEQSPLGPPTECIFDTHTAAAVGSLESPGAR